MGERDGGVEGRRGEAQAGGVDGDGEATSQPQGGGASGEAQPKGWPSRRLPADTRYFVMKSFCARDLKISMGRSLWATQPRNEERLNAAYAGAGAVVLFFSVNESRAFQGYARMSSRTGDAAEASGEEAPLWTSADGAATAWGSVFRVKWQTIFDLPFEQVRVCHARAQWHTRERGHAHETCCEVNTHHSVLRVCALLVCCSGDASAQPSEREQANQDIS